MCIMFLLIYLATFLIICVNAEISNETEIDDISEFRRNGPNFLFTYPKTLLAGKNETICLNLYEANLPAKALIDLKIKEKHHVFTKMMHTEHACFEMYIPMQKSTDVLSASFHLQLQLNGTIHQAHNQEPIFIYSNSDVTFIETDRGIYKQGDKIRIRLLLLTQDLKASPKQTMSSIKIVNPSGFTVAVWDKVTLELGLAQIDYQLADETMLGKWKIECNDLSKTFQVQKYVLPRFKVAIFHQKSIYSETENVKFSICARYSYGKHVQGMALLKTSFPEPTYVAKNKIKPLFNGCTIFELSNNELNLHSIGLHFETWNLNVIATVTEQKSNRVETETIKIKVTKQAYELKFLDENQHFQPGLPYRGKLKIMDAHFDVSHESVEICYNIAVRKLWNIKPEECSNFTYDDDFTVSFNLLPFKDSVVGITLMARSINYTNIQTTMVLNRWYSASNNYINIGRNIKGISKCKSLQQFTIYYTTNKFKSNENITFYYMLKSRNDILQMKKIHHKSRKQTINFKNELINIVGKEHKFSKNESYVDKFSLKFKLHNEIISKSKLMVFYFFNDETIASSIDIYVAKCLMNAVSTKWFEQKLYPGEAALLSIKSSPNSLCAVSVTDKANTFLSNSRPLNIPSLLLPFLLDKTPMINYKPNCLVNQKRKLDAIMTESPVWDLRKKRSYSILTTDDFDSHEVFNSIGLSFITNTKMIQKPCVQKASPAHILAAEEIFEVNSDLEYDILDEDRGISIRSQFPETWLWELVPTSRYGEAKISRYLPHTITTWNANTICVSPINGVGIAPVQELVVFQPFFIDIITPYSIKRNEIVHLQVILFNYLNYSLPIRITLGDTNGLRLMDEKDDIRTTICLKPDDTQTHTFRAKAVIIGKINLTVLAEIESSFPSECGPDVIINKRDVVYKSIIVEPEGYPMEFVNSSLLCGKAENNNATWIINLPDTIEDSEKVKIIINSDLLGPTIQNLDKLLNIPTGCGEQVMATMAPNLYILRYLKSNNKLTPTIQQRAIKNLKIGYQRILDHAHKDGSFSAFGYYDTTGSMFLTSFVVRTLQQAKEYTYIDEKIIKRATKWITENQLENGCFASVSHVFQDMGGTSTENSTAALTAYVIISLLESNIELSETVRTNAMYCIRGSNSHDKYTLAISTYALYLINWHNQADLLLKRLMDVANKDGSLLWWTNPTGSSSENIEMTAYALMALLYKASPEHLLHAGSIVRWLATQRGTQGGFLTTQDTAVALDAISRYAMLVKDKDPELSIKIASNDEKFDFKMHKKDRLKSKQIILKNVPDSIKIIANGDGCILAQLSVTYHVNHQLSTEAFKLDVTINSVSTIDKCSVAIVSPCISYTGIGHSNMAILEVYLPSGYEADRASLYFLNTTILKKFEEFKEKVVFYFTKLGTEQICIPFKINENIIIENHMDAIIKLYDYYNPELQVSTTYKVNKCETDGVPLLPTKTRGFRIIDESPVEYKNKRDLKHAKFGFNKDFVDLDVDMATPAGIEGNEPTYVKLDDIRHHKKQNSNL